MEESKISKTTVRVFFGIIGLLLLFFVFNQFDARVPENMFRYENLVQASFEATNGFYLVVGMAEAPEVDVLEEETVFKYRGLNEPGPNRDRCWDAFDVNGYHKMFSPYRRKIRFLNQHKKDWCRYVAGRRVEIEAAAGKFSFLLTRYEKLLQANEVRDFAMPPFDVLKEPLLMTSRLYTALKVADALDGKTDAGIDGLLTQLALCKKLVNSARGLETASTWRTMMRDTLIAINSIMNQKECPRSVVEKVFRGMTSFAYEHYGNRNAYIAHYLFIDYWMDDMDRESSRWHKRFNKEFTGLMRAFLQMKRTKNYYFTYISTLLKFDGIPPYQWPSKLPFAGNLRQGPVWWLQNPIGKYLYSKVYNPVLHSHIFSAYRTKTLYDLVRTGAELRLNHDGTESVGSLLKKLASFQALDPFSGEPYKWNQSKAVLYGVGLDRNDDGGLDRDGNYSGDTFDIVVPVTL